MSLPAFRSHLHGLWDGVYVGGCQNYGPLLGTLNVRCRTIQGTQKGTIILTTTHVRIRAHIVQYSMCPVMYNTIHTHVQIYVICTYVHTCMHTCIHSHTPTCTYTYTYTYTCTHTCASVYIYICTCGNTYILRVHVIQCRGASMSCVLRLLLRSSVN